MYFLISDGIQFLTGPNRFFQHYIMTVTVRDWCAAPVLFIPVTQKSLSFIIQYMFEPSGYFSVISIRLPERFIQNDEAPQMLFIHPVLSSSPPETLISVLRLIKWCWSIWEANLCDTCYWRVSDKSCGASERQLDWWTQAIRLCAIRHHLIGTAHCYIKSRMANLQYSERCIWLRNNMIAD